ncbi:hypothetical protein ACFFMR_19045 [Micromonospora andamanensis]|uniref:Uncharacterized protein n=1 Tax=Micromonospora andamanensis TaxID=1287068 RepID=A0ABQ4HYL8_9ACTN|nr:hypothetical protein [Micromonospora andamanensis]GIJ10765.1 hypothetical protein Van01_39790 [Micromonospora andamanensis]
MTMPDGTPQGPWHPIHHPVGLDFDRADTEGVDAVRSQPLGIGGEPLPGRNAPITVPGLACGHIEGDLHDDECAYWRGVASGEYAAPVVHLPPYDLRDLRARGVTAAELHRAEHGRGAA